MMLELMYFGNCQSTPVCSKNNLFGFILIKIKIPKNKQSIQELEPTFQQIETLQHEVKVADELYKQLIQELSQEAIPQQSNNTFVPVTIKTNTENFVIPIRIRVEDRRVHLVEQNIDFGII